MKSFSKRLLEISITLVTISVLIVVMNMFFSAGQKELCGKLYEQKVEHETMGLYPDFFISKADQNTCREIGYSL